MEEYGIIRASNIKKNGKEADFRCEIHGGTATNLDLKTKVKRVKNKDGKSSPDPTSEDIITISGQELTPPCICLTSYPVWHPDNKLGYELGQAKTKDD